MKNKLGETKAWATSATAKSTQAQFICLCANLLTLLDYKMKQEEGIKNFPEIKRREKRLAMIQKHLNQENQTPAPRAALGPEDNAALGQINPLVAAQVWLNNSWKEACEVLIGLYAVV